MATIPPRLNEVLEEQNNRVRIIANTGPMCYKTGGVFSGLLVEAMVGDDRIGYLTAEKRGGTYVMDGVYVEPEYRQNGIATNMVRKAHETVPMTPYILTDNQVYQSEIGKKIAINEYRMVTASTIVTAGPLLAIPELLGAGEAIAGAGEAAAGAEEAGGMGKLLNNMPSGGGSNNQQSSDSNDINDQPSTSSQDFSTPANPVMGSTMPLETHPLAPPKPIVIPPFTIPGKPSKTPTGNEIDPMGVPKIKPAEDKTEATPEVSLEAETADKKEQQKVDTKVKAPTDTNTKFKPIPQGNRPSGLNIELDFPQTISNFPTPARPMTGSANSNRLYELLEEDQMRIANIEKTTTWE
jgi:hypothetical protein